MSTVSIIVSQIGRQRLMALLDVKRSSISNACVDGVFPARWYLAVSTECARLGIDCPRSLFNFIEPMVPEACEGGAAHDAAIPDELKPYAPQEGREPSEGVS